MTTIVVFSSSLLVASALVLIKAVELRRGNKNILLGLISRLDNRLEKMVSNLKFRSLQLIQSFRYLVLVRVKEICKDCLRRMEEKAASELKKRQDVIMMGKKEIISKGSVSFYLKKITEDKGSGERGKIEDHLLE